jgi:hypothetical protein
VCEALKTQKNPRHAPCPEQSNRTAVDLIRASINYEMSLTKRMDCRVKPGNDEWKSFAETTW